MKTMKPFIHIYTLFVLLCFGGMATEAWAAKVTYHVLTLPIDASTANMVSAVDGKRLEAIRVIVDNAATIELPAHFKSPLAENFKYWASSQVSASAATELYSGSSRVKEIIYTLDTSSETAEGTSVDSNCDIYVTYEKNNLVTFNDNGHPYMLKFLQPHAEGYYLEDGKDKLTTEKIQAVYPYCNGDGNLNIYGTAMNEEQMNGGANTRPRADLRGTLQPGC